MEKILRKTGFRKKLFNKFYFRPLKIEMLIEFLRDITNLDLGILSKISELKL